MPSVVLSQLPIPRQNFGRRTGSVPLGAACLKQAAVGLPAVQVQILPQPLAACLGDAALLSCLQDMPAEIYGFTVFSWNLERSLHMAGRLKEGGGPRIGR